MELPSVFTGSSSHESPCGQSEGLTFFLKFFRPSLPVFPSSSGVNNSTQGEILIHKAAQGRMLGKSVPGSLNITSILALDSILLRVLSNGHTVTYWKGPFLLLFRPSFEKAVSYSLMYDLQSFYLPPLLTSLAHTCRPT